MAVLESSLAVLFRLVDCNTTNIINETFYHLLEQFDALLAASSQPVDNVSKLHQAQHHRTSTFFCSHITCTACYSSQVSVWNPRPLAQNYRGPTRLFGAEAPHLILLGFSPSRRRQLSITEP